MYPISALCVIALFSCILPNHQNNWEELIDQAEKNSLILKHSQDFAEDGIITDREYDILKKMYK